MHTSSWGKKSSGGGGVAAERCSGVGLTGVHLPLKAVASAHTVELRQVQRADQPQAAKDEGVHASRATASLQREDSFEVICYRF